MIVITGAAGFIGSCLVARLNQEKMFHLMLVDDFSSEKKKRNYESKKFLNIIGRNEFLDWWDLQNDSVDFVFHLGARTDTTESNQNLLNDLNLHYSQEIWNRCTHYRIPIIYASSAATYGAGEFGYDDDHSLIPKLQPLNPYGVSKNEFDKWVLQQSFDGHGEPVEPSARATLRQAPEKIGTGQGDKQQSGTPPFWCGLKFFNVFGPNEYHKGRMASVVFHGFNQIKQNGIIKLFRSHRSDYENGKQLRDFIYVKDVVDVMLWFMNHQQHSGIYNLGSGKARTFLDLATATFRAMNLEPDIEFIDIPEDIRDWYQYFTEARIEKLRSIGYERKFYSLEQAVTEYVKEYLLPDKAW
ncbi:MAG TPA: NAD-dependent epimerase/dehydratase family protein [Chitinophagales bacterium]|nr:NAD-dependent epimerase/dehydratase family protein [Chitinophagales bacterium]